MSEHRNENTANNPSENLPVHSSQDPEHANQETIERSAEIQIERTVEGTVGSAEENLLVEKPAGDAVQHVVNGSDQNLASGSAQNTADESVQDTASESVPELVPEMASHERSYQTNRPAAQRGRGRPTLKMTKEQLMAAIGGVADKLGHVPSHAELMRSGKVSGRQIVKHFGTYTRALRACNLERSMGGHKVPLEKLFLDWARVVRELKRIPSKADYETMGKHSITPLRARFGTWGQVPRYLRRYMEEQGLTEEWKDVMELIHAYEQGQDGMEMAPSPECEQKKPSTLKPRVMTDRPVYGPLIRPYPAIHGPINEDGVIYLFGTVSYRLGFVVTLIQGAFPDCHALRLVDVDRWQPVRIEFEYESRNFLRHLHDPSQCDIIVCWKHNWPECPLEVLELKQYLTADQRG
jgi:hypothetical protein